MADLATMFDWLLLDLDGDGQPDAPRGHICLSPTHSDEEALCALNIAARLAYESCAFAPGLLSVEPPQGVGDIALRSDPDCTDGFGTISLDEHERLCLRARPGQLLPLSRYLFARAPYLGAIGAGAPTLSDVGCPVRGIVVRTADGTIDALMLDSDRAPQAALPDVPAFVLRDGSRVENLHARPLVLAQQACAPQAAPENIDLCNLFSPKGLYTDPIGDLLNNACPFVVRVPREMSGAQLAMACEFVVRLALDALQVSFDFVVHDAPEGVPCICFDDGDAARTYIEGGALHLQGDGEDGVRLGRFLATRYPYVDAAKTLPIAQMMQHLRHTLSGRTGQGQLAAALLCPDTSEAYIDEVPELIERIDGVQVQGCRTPQEVFSFGETLPWEVDTFRTLAEAQIDAAQHGSNVHIGGFLSEPESVRRDLAEQLIKHGRAAGVTVSCEIFCAFKQGLSWVRERVLRDTAHLKGKVAAARLHFRPAAYDGIDDWGSFDGDFPPFDIADKGWREVPLFLLTEIYPFDDYLSDGLGIARDDITFHAARQSCDYSLELLDAAGAVVWQSTFDTAQKQCTFLPEFPKLGDSTIFCSRIMVSCDGADIFSQDIATDIEQAWRFYTERALPKVRDFITERDGKVCRANQPFFSELQLSVTASEPDEALCYRTDRASSLEGLHEDIYFTGLDYFAYLGEGSSGEKTDEPGLILPMMVSVEGGAPEVQASLFAPRFAHPMRRTKDGVLEQIALPGGAVTLREMTCRDKRVALQLDCPDAAAFAVLNRYAALVAGGQVGGMMAELWCDVCIHGPDGQSCTFAASQKRLRVEVPFQPERLETGDDVVSVDQYIEMMEHLRAVPGIKVYPAAHSREGRPVYVFENIDTDHMPMVSLHKRINRKPTVFIANRHHANEVSSTTMAFALLRDMLSGGEYAHFLKKLNIAMLPFENVDGGAVHQRLQRDNPEWMLHAARFNAAGIDFGCEYMDEETKHTEALAATRLFYRWLPDIMADNHGIPHHECLYPMSSYHKPGLKAHWLPRAIWYGILYYHGDAQHAQNDAATDAVRNVTAAAIGGDDALMARNIEWRDRYQKYGYQFMPKLFEAEFFREIIYYHYPVGKHGSVPNARFIAQTHPHICAMGWITEAADETAQGDYLRLCARAHLKATVATLQMLCDNGVVLENRDCDGARPSLCRKRTRPMEIAAEKGNCCP